MKGFNYIVVYLVVLILSTGCFASSQAKESWWLMLKLEANDTKLNGLPVSSFNADWAYASFIDTDEIKQKIGDEDYQNFKNSSFSFSKELDLNQNGVDENIHVGVYKNNSNDEGIFLAIFEKGKLVKVLTDSTHQNFSTLLISEGDLLWYRCMECGNHEKLIWTGSSYFLE